jgi:hypothetical protein
VGIHNIRVLHEPPEMNHSARQMQEFIQAKRVVEHKAGKHPFGLKRRDCPLCVAGK